MSKATRFSWIHGLLSVVFCWAMAPPSSAQEATPLFPSGGETVRTQDLIDRGFEWVAPEGADHFEIRFFGPDPFLSQQTVPSAEPVWKLDTSLTRFFQTENFQYQWQITSLDTAGVNLGITPSFSFFIDNTVLKDIIPTPTPQTRPTPSGDLDGSAKVDARDLFILSLGWKRESGQEFGNGDLNQDAVISGEDLFLYSSRFTVTVPSPTPTPFVGIPQNLRFLPGDEVGINESSGFTIQWDPPAFPSGVEIVYDLAVSPPFQGGLIEAPDLTNTSHVPFPQGITFVGEYKLHLRAKLASGEKGNIVTSTFKIVTSKPGTPTPTQVPQTSDITADGVSDFLDMALFTNAFGSEAGLTHFNPLADLFTDGVIDRKDLILFQLFFSQKNALLPKPEWLTVEIPVLDGNTCMETGRQTIDLPPNEIQFGFSSSLCALAELFGTVITFSEVPDAIDYFVTVRSEVDPNLLLEFFTQGKTSIFQRITIFKPGEIFLVQVQAAGKGLQLGEKSETLRLILPSQN